MTKQRKTIQLSLILIGTILILMTYFLYPKISKKDVAKQTDTEIQKKITGETEGTSYFENLEYKGFYNINNPFLVKSKEAVILEKEPDLVHITSMKVVIEMKDGRVITITSDKGIYNKQTYDCFFRDNVKATDGKTVLNSDNIDLLASSDIAEVYNNVILRSDKGSLIADKIEYDFEKKYYKVSMFNNKKVKVKLTE